MEERAGKWPEKEYPLQEITESIIAAAVEVHRVLGPGYLEKIYEHALVAEFLQRGHDVKCQQIATVFYKGHPVGQHRMDLLVDDEVVVELKSVDALAHVHEAQLRSTLKAASKRVGLLMNFNQKTLVEGLRRVIN